MIDEIIELPDYFFVKSRTKSIPNSAINGKVQQT